MTTVPSSISDGSTETVLYVYIVLLLAPEISNGIYCKFRNFRENFIFANSIKRHICDVKNRDQGMIYLYQ